MYIRLQLIPLDVPKSICIFNIAGETDYGIEQRPAFRDVGLQRSIELLDINGVAILILFFVAFHEETVAVVNLKARQCIENDVAETGIACELSIFIFKVILDIFYVSNNLLIYLDEFALTFGVKSGES